MGLTQEELARRLKTKKTEISKEDKKSLAKKLCGTWAGHPSIDSIFEEIEKERHSYHRRGIDLDTPVLIPIS